MSKNEKIPMDSPKRTQKKSTSYALKSASNHIYILRENGSMSVEDWEIVMKIIQEATTKYIKKEFGI